MDIPLRTLGRHEITENGSQVEDQKHKGADHGQLVLTEFPDKYLVAASGMAGLGDANSIQTRQITKHFFLCGDGVSEVTEKESLVSSRVMLCAAHQAHKVLQLIEENF